MNQPTNTRWLTGKCVLRYLQVTKSFKLFYPQDNDFHLHGEGKADWSGDHKDRPSTTGYFLLLGFSGGAISWQTKKQQTVAPSYSETDYQGLAAAGQEATFLRSIICEMGCQQMQATCISEVNQSCINQLNNPVMHKRLKHIDTKYHFIRKKVDYNAVELVYALTDQLATDLLPKALPQVKVELHRRVLLGQNQILLPIS